MSLSIRIKVMHKHLTICRRSRSRAKKYDNNLKTATTSTLPPTGPHTHTPAAILNTDNSDGNQYLLATPHTDYSCLYYTGEQVFLENEEFEEFLLDSYDISSVKETLCEGKPQAVPPVSTDEFGDYVARCHSNQNRDFKAQFAVWSTI